MTLPDERYRAIAYTEKFLADLCSPNITPRVPSHIRTRARNLLRHYPDAWDLERLAEKSPDVIIKQIEPLTRMLMQYDTEKNGDNAS